MTYEDVTPEMMTYEDVTPEMIAQKCGDRDRSHCPYR